MKIVIGTACMVVVIVALAKGGAGAFLLMAVGAVVDLFWQARRGRLARG